MIFYIFHNLPWVRLFNADTDDNLGPGVDGVWTFDWQWERRDPHLLQCEPALTLQQARGGQTPWQSRYMGEESVLLSSQ